MHTHARIGLRNGLKGKLKTIAAATLLLTTLNINVFAQDAQPVQHQRNETYGNTLNLGIGIGYYGYLGGDAPFFFANYEFNVARDFTLAPFIGFGSYQSGDYYNNGYGYYYTETVIPVGIKGTYYFDRLLGAGPRWDFYGAASLGVTYDNVEWQDGYTGDRNVARSQSRLYADLHIGSEYHFNRRMGIFLDLSTGVSTIGLAFHHL